MSDSIIINEANRGRLEAWMCAARGRAHARPLTVDDLRDACPELERRLDPLPVADRVGARAVVRAGYVVSWHYTSAREDQVRLVRRRGGWAVESLDRVPCGTGLAYTARSQIVAVQLAPHQFHGWADRVARSRDIEIAVTDHLADSKDVGDTAVAEPREPGTM